MTSNPEVTREDYAFADRVGAITEERRAIVAEQASLYRTQAEAKSKVEIAEAVGALRWLRAFWEPGIDHDTQEVQHALAAADAAPAKHSEKPDA